jgi:hypothetical protein
MRKPNPRKTNDAHVGIGELEDLRKKDKSCGKPDEQNTGGALCGAEKEPQDPSHAVEDPITFREQILDR